LVAKFIRFAESFSSAVAPTLIIITETGKWAALKI
jgi:hypothetical protein